MHILLVDDQELVCFALAEQFKKSTPERIQVNLAFTFAAAVSALFDDPNPEIIFLDLDLGDGRRSIDTLSDFVKLNTRNIPIVVLTDLCAKIPNEREVLRACLRDFGVRGVLLKGGHLDEMFLGISRILQGGAWVPTDLLMELASTNPPVIPECHLVLSAREREVANLIVKGYPDKKIANELHLQPGYIRQVVTQIFKKLGVPNRTAAAEKLLRTRGDDVDLRQDLRLPSKPLPSLTCVTEQFGNQSIQAFPKLVSVPIQIPDQDVPAAFARFLGNWGGYWCGILPSNFVVTDMTRDGEFRAVYAWGTCDQISQIRAPGAVNVRGRVVGDELGWGRYQRISFSFKFQPGGTLYGERWEDGSESASVVMRKSACD
jgi:two-component system, NarL family, nitrate/nitrite response regulator NarL